MRQTSDPAASPRMSSEMRLTGRDWLALALALVCFGFGLAIAGRQ